MPTTGTLQATIDTTLGTLLPLMIADQAIYRGAHPKNFQGILTTSLATLQDHTDIGLPLIEVPTLTSKPTDQNEDWTAFTTAIPGTLLGAIEIASYGGPFGLGWTLNSYYKHTGRVFCRKINTGSENGFDMAWKQIS